MKHIYLSFLICSFSALMAGAATLRYNDVIFELDTEKRTSPALAIFLNGTTYYGSLMNVDVPGRLRVAYEGVTYSLVQWTLVYEQESINSCVTTVQLKPGEYRIEIKGGRGGDGGYAADTGQEAVPEVQYFSFSAPTTVTTFRGG